MIYKSKSWLGKDVWFMLCPTKESYPSSPEGGMNDNSLILLGKRIRELRVKHGLSQEKLSELSGISSRHISEMERGESNPSFQVMEQLTFALGVSMKEFFDFEHHADLLSSTPATAPKRASAPARFPSFLS